MLFAQYKFGSDFDKQKVVCKIFNPYGDGTWFIMNSDPNDPDYMWAIVKMFGNVEVGSVSRSELESISFFGMNIGLERDISFEPTNAKQVYEGLLKGEHFAKGGKMGFKGLSAKVAAHYEGKSVPAKYQKEYGKTYDAAEAKKVGNKVAAKVYRQQLAKKKFALGGNTSDQPKIYVEELIAHKEGLDDGEWIILTDYNDGDEIMDYINDLLEQWSEKYGEERDEYIVSAYENFDEEYYDKFMDEIQFDEILEAHNKGGNLQEISDDKGIPVDVLKQVVSDFDPDDLAEWIDNNYYGYFRSETKLAEEYISNIGGITELDDNTLQSHFDYSSFGSDLAHNYSEYDGYYFNNYKRGGVMPKHDLSKYVKKKVSLH
jgi:hypothetical protein